MRGAEAYYSPSMVENPWAELEKRLGVPPPRRGSPSRQQLQQSQAAASPAAGLEARGEAAAEGKRLAAEGALDRPWH